MNHSAQIVDCKNALFRCSIALTQSVVVYDNELLVQSFCAQNDLSANWHQNHEQFQENLQHDSCVTLLISYALSGCDTTSWSIDMVKISGIIKFSYMKESTNIFLVFRKNYEEPEQVGQSLTLLYHCRVTHFGK